MKNSKTKTKNKEKILFEINRDQKIIWKDTARTLPGTETPSVLLHVMGELKTKTKKLKHTFALDDAPAGLVIPTSWLDPMLTGPESVIGMPPYDCLDIERLLNAIRKRFAVKISNLI